MAKDDAKKADAKKKAGGEKKAGAKQGKVADLRVEPVVSQFHDVLREAGMGHLRVHSLTLAPVAEGAETAGGPCPPGQTWRCRAKPHGVIECGCEPDDGGD